VKYLGAFGRFWWDFIVGDDWRVAAGIAIGLGLTHLFAHTGLNVWWLLPFAVALVLAASLWGAARAAVGHEALRGRSRAHDAASMSSNVLHTSRRRDRGARNDG
jgi:fructose-specific phosphotransferase system IIC component